MKKIFLISSVVIAGVITIICSTLNSASEDFDDIDWEDGFNYKR